MRLALALLVVAAAAPAYAQVKTGDRARDFEQRSLTTGDTLKLSALRGHVVLLDFWASWCEPCKKELPILARMAPRLHDKGVEIVTVNIDERRENAEAFLREHGLKLNVVHDQGQRIVKDYEPPKMPSSFIIDRAGVVRAVNAGFEPGDEAKIERLLTSVK